MACWLLNGFNTLVLYVVYCIILGLLYVMWSVVGYLF